MAKEYTVGIVGATGAVGKEMVKVLYDRNFPTSKNKIALYASERSAGKQLETPFGTMTIELFSVEAASKNDYVLMAVSGDFAEKFAPELAKNTIVIDNSSAFRYKDDVPLVIPEVNAHTMAGKSLIANPNCTTAIAAMALWPIYKEKGLEAVIMSTYQASSGAGAEGMEELEDGLRAWARGEPVQNKVFAHQLPFNVIPHIDKFQENLYTKEEMKVTWETQKIFGDKSIKCSCTAVRIPTLRAHSEAITVKTRLPCTPDEARALLRRAEGVEVVDSPSEQRYPMPLNATAKADVEVGRVRRSLVFGERGLDLFVSGDQLLRGAALNAVLIAEAHLRLLTSCCGGAPRPQRQPFRAKLRARRLASWGAAAAAVAGVLALALARGRR